MRTFNIIIVILTIAAACVYAKPRTHESNAGGLFRAGEASGLSSAEIEKRFRPYIEQKIRGRRDAHGSGRQSAGSAERGIRPTPKDFLLLMKVWDSLSPEFRALYNEATNIPANFDSHISPMGKFRIYYTTAGRDSIHPKVDTMGYGNAGKPSTWRERRSAANGVPDYIDETAFAFDSAWTMLVDRFGFDAPLPDSGAYYRIHVRNMDDTYGVTDPRGKPSGSSRGFSSIIELNSNWTDPYLWGGPPQHYDKNPYPAVWVTAVHELFHASQYAAAWNIYFNQSFIDDYPLAWLEGSATLMEDLAFPDVNDYLQYIGDYFTTPGISFLNDYNIYANSILFKYLYEKTAPRDSIGFIKTVMDGKTAQSNLSFFINLEQTSQRYARKHWAEILNGFHTESYFTGKRARRPWAFVSDAEMMSEWTLPAAPPQGKESAEVPPHSVKFFRCTPQHNHPDTLYLNINGQSDPNAPGPTWAASVLIFERTDSVGIMPVPINNGGYGTAVIENWKAKNGCVLVVTNASPSLKRQLTVNPADSALVTPEPNESVTISVAPNTIKLRAGKPMLISGGDIAEVKVVSANGKIMGYYNSAKAPSDGFIKYQEGAVEWYPDKRMTPGAYYILAVPVSGGKTKPQKRKIMILP